MRGEPSKRKNDGAEEQFRSVKKERLAENGESTQQQQQQQEQDPASRRMIRSQFLELKSLINEKKDDLMNTDSDKFDTILNEFKILHDQVQKPREQVADAEALLDLTRTLVGSVKSLANDGITPSRFVASLLRNFAQDAAQNSINWKKLGIAVSPIFMNAHGCSTMLGPMENELKQRKTGVQRKRTKPTTEKARPEEIDESTGVEKNDTDKNMLTMFGILKKMKRVPLESLILNRMSFAQTVENLFSLSFLVKDGRAEISVDENRSHYVSPKNAPDAALRQKKEASLTHFIFRYDYQDWMLMKDVVPEGKELMPHRIQFCTVIDSQTEMGGYNSQSALSVTPIRLAQPEMGGDNSQPALSVTPIRKFSRNRGLVVQEEGVVEESPECDEESVSRAAAIRRCKRKLIKK